MVMHKLVKQWQVKPFFTFLFALGKHTGSYTVSENCLCNGSDSPNCFQI